MLPPPIARRDANASAPGKPNGLLAYDDEAVVGWCNVGPRDAFVNLRAYAEAVEPGDAPTGSVMCFVVHPEHRHRGVATALLASVDDYLRDLGMATAEGYPRAAPPADPAFPWTAASYKGTRTCTSKPDTTSTASSTASW